MPLTGTVIHERNEVIVMWVRTPMKRSFLFENSPRTNSSVLVPTELRTRSKKIENRACAANSLFLPKGDFVFSGDFPGKTGLRLF